MGGRGGRVMAEIPEYYFRIRDNGASVFHVQPQDRESRLEMVEIAAVNVKNGKIRAHGDHVLSGADRTAIEAWLEVRRGVVAAREAARPAKCIEALNQTAHWAQTRASVAELDAATDGLLLAMHDLRRVLVRKRAERSADK